MTAGSAEADTRGASSMKHRHVMLLVCIGITIVLSATTSCAQLPSSAAVVSASRCPAYPDTQFLDPEKFDIGALTDGRCGSHSG
jgi:hypothetical protein